MKKYRNSQNIISRIAGAALVTSVVGAGCGAEFGGEYEPGASAAPLSITNLHGAMDELLRSPTSAAEAFADPDSELALMRRHGAATVDMLRELEVDSALRGQPSDDGVFSLLEGLCIEESIDFLIEMAQAPLPTSRVAMEHGGFSDRALGQNRRRKAVAALGAVSGKSCGAGMSAETVQGDYGRQVLEDWVLDSGMSADTRMFAGEALLSERPERAAALRWSLPADQQWMLTPITERIVDMDTSFSLEPPAPDPSLEGAAHAEVLGAFAEGEVDSVYHSYQGMSVEIDPSDFEAGTVHGDDPEPVYLDGNATCANDLDSSWSLFSRDGYPTGDTYIADRIDLIGSIVGWGCEDLFEHYDNVLNFNDSTWDEGFGLHDKCNDRKGLKRTVNAFYTMEYASPSRNPVGDYSGDVLDWAWNYTRANSSQWMATCEGAGDGGGGVGDVVGFTGHYVPGGCSISGWTLNCRDEAIRLSRSFMKSLDVASRAGTLLHEARHAGGYSHNGGDDCPRGRSCDSSFSYGGANALQVDWLVQYSRRAYTYVAARYMRDDARDAANTLLKSAFVTCPNVQVNDSGYYYYTPGVCFM